MKYTYFPGCSLLGIGRACEESTRAVFSTLGVELQELDDWNCCGATAYMGVDENKAIALAARNLALADSQGCEELTTPCSGCFLVLNKAQRFIEEYPQVGQEVKGALKAAGLTYTGKVRVRHMLDVLVNDVGLDEVKKHVKRPLTNAKVAAYYGCQTVRPYQTFDDPNNPMSMDHLALTLGAKAVHYPLKARCCGGSQMGTVPTMAQELVHALLREARRNGANTVLTACPLCQFNLDSYQPDVNRLFGEDVSIMTLYFTQLVGLAFGISPETLGLPRNITWDGSWLEKELLLAPAAA